MQETNNILAILDNYLHDNPDEIAKEMANDFRKRRIEKNMTREQVADKSGVAVSNITRFEAHPINLGGNFLILQKIYTFVP